MSMKLLQPLFSGRRSHGPVTWSRADHWAGPEQKGLFRFCDQPAFPPAWLQLLSRCITRKRRSRAGAPSERATGRPSGPSALWSQQGQQCSELLAQEQARPLSCDQGLYDFRLLVVLSTLRILQWNNIMSLMAKPQTCASVSHFFGPVQMKSSIGARGGPGEAALLQSARETRYLSSGVWCFLNDGQVSWDPRLRKLGWVSVASTSSYPLACYHVSCLPICILYEVMSAFFPITSFKKGCNGLCFY